MDTHVLKIPCNAMPFICEADYSITLGQMIHADRVAPFHVAIYLLRGSMEIIEDGIPYELLPHQLFFLKGNVHHWGEKPFEEGSAWYYAHFYCSEPEPQMQKLSGNVYHDSKIPQASVRLWQIFLECVKNVSEDYVGNVYVRKLQEYIRIHYINGFTAEEIEAACGLSYKYAGTLFKETTGQTIREYQRTLRIRRAKQLLEETDVSVTEIAQLTGFSDVFYFSKVFRAGQGCSPSEYRRTYIPGI